MALVRTLMTSGGASAVAVNTNATTASFNTTSGGLLVWCLTGQRGGYNLITTDIVISNSAGLTISPTAYFIDTTLDDWDSFRGIYTAPIVTGGATTLSVKNTGNGMDSFAWRVFLYTGQSASPLGVTAATGVGAGTSTLPITLSGTPLASSEVLLFAQNEDGTPPTPTDFTLEAAFAQGFPQCMTATRTGSTSNSILIPSASHTYGEFAVALEILAGGIVDSSIPYYWVSM